MKIITCTGFGNSGSSAATDFFSEFNNVEVVPHELELTFIHESDGLYDLEKAIREGHRLKVDLAVKRFILLTEKINEQYQEVFGNKFMEYTKEFIVDSIGCKWDGWWHRAFETEPLTLKQRIVARQINHKFVKQCSYNLYENDNWRSQYLPPTTEYYESDIEKFISIARKYVSKLLKCLNKNMKQFLVVDQLVPPTNPELYLHYFDDIKVIIVDRDPRDYYFANNMFWASRYIPSEDLDTYICWYRKTRNLIGESSSVKRVYLEDFIYNYEDISKCLISFCDMDCCNWTDKGKFFLPSCSEKNASLFLKYNGLETEISKISKQLSDYLFDFHDNIQVDKKDVVPAMELVRKFDLEFKQSHISLKGLLISISANLKKHK